MEIDSKFIITSILVIFKVAVILNFILKFRRMKLRVKELEIENAELKSTQNNTTLKESA